MLFAGLFCLTAHDSPEVCGTQWSKFWARVVVGCIKNCILPSPPSSIYFLVFYKFLKSIFLVF
ncbi:MAG: hypothetical protein JXA16_12465 [Bacteroidales bacterium]|nr:hypothetical protein [Bacteroidales bacterium]